MKTQVAIIGGGPSGLLLSQLLNRFGIATVVLERASRKDVTSRGCPGILEPGSVDILREAGVADRLDKDGIPHEGFSLTDDNLMVRIDFHRVTGKKVVIYGEAEVTADLYAAQDALGATIIHGVSDVSIMDVTTRAPYVDYTLDGARHRLDCLYVVGCDGVHGVSRETIPAEKRRAFERIYPFGWLGLRARTPPAHQEVIYAHSRNGFALASQHHKKQAYYAVQVPTTARVENWSDDRFWAKLKTCLPEKTAQALVTGPSIDKSITPVRSYVGEPLRWGRLFLAGDATHILPPTGAKWLNLALSDVTYLYQALIDAVMHGKDTGVDAYSDRALARIWTATRLSWQMTTMLHHFEGEDAFAAQMRKATLAHLATSETARRDLAANYVGLPL